MFNNSSIKIEPEKIGWYVWISVFSFVFSITALIYRPEYINYGFITIAYGIIAWLIDTAFHLISKENKKYWILFLFEFTLVGIWIFSLWNVWYWIELSAK